MAKKFKDLIKKMSPEAQKEIAERRAEYISELPLHDLRTARSMTQTQIAKILDIKQPTVSKLERRTDMYISTLRSYIEAMGGDLRITAEFQEGIVDIDLFADIGSDEAGDTDLLPAAKQEPAYDAA